MLRHRMKTRSPSQRVVAECCSSWLASERTERLSHRLRNHEERGLIYIRLGGDQGYEFRGCSGGPKVERRSCQAVALLINSYFSPFPSHSIGFEIGFRTEVAII